MKSKDVFTTGDVARICHVAPRTVSKWVDSGVLRGYRIPGSRDRRVPANLLMQFMRAHGMPLHDLEGHATRVLLVDSDAAACNALEGRIAADSRYQTRQAANDFQAGLRAGEFQPHVVFVNVACPHVDACELLRNIRANAALAATRVVALAGALTRGQRESLLRDGFDAVLCQPCSDQDLARAIEDSTDLA